MPFMLGSAPIRRTSKYLEMGKVVLRETVRIFSINYNMHGKHHEGARDFVFWYLPQIQYKNPSVQCITLKNLTPSPFIRIYFEDNKSVLIDIDSREKEEILNHLINFTAVCKNKKEINDCLETSETKINPAYFGFGCERQCMCEIFNQVPCSGITPLPYHWRGIKDSKYRIPPCFMELGLEKTTKEDDE